MTAQESITIKAEIILKPNGSCVIKGPVQITHEDGSIEIRENNAAICRCGLSKEMPFCDGSHRVA